MRKTLQSCFVSLLMLFAYTGGNVALADSYTIDLSDSNSYPSGFPTASSDEATYTLTGTDGTNDVSIDLQVYHSYKNSGYLMMKAQGASISYTPTKAISAVKVTTSSGGSKAVTANLSVNGTDVQTTATTLNAQSTEFTFSVPESSQQANVAYKFYVANKKNAQLTKIEFVFVDEDDDRTATSVSFDGNEYTAYVGGTFDAPKATLEPSEAGSVTYSSKDESVAKVDATTGEVTLGTTEGETVITATFEGNDDYKESSASYTLTVLKPAVAEVTVTTESSYEETMTYSLGSFTASGTFGDDETAVWSWDSQYTCAKGTAYNGTVNAAEAYLTSPKITLDNSGVVTSAKIEFQHAGMYFGTIAEEVFLQVSTDGTTWTDLTIDSYPSNFTFVDATVDLSDYIGQSIYLRFKYTSSTSAAGTWEIKNIVVSESAKENVTLSFEESSTIIEVGDTYTQAATTTPTGITGVTYKSSVESVASVDENGTVTGVAGSITPATITASFAGDETYNAANDATYSVYVAHKVEDGVFNLQGWQDYDSGMLPSYTDDITTQSHTFTAGNITMTTNGKHRWWLTKDGTNINFRFFYPDESEDNGGNFTISCGEDQIITKIVLTGNSLGKLVTEDGTYSSGTWTGESQSVLFTNTLTSTTKGNVQIYTITVTYVKKVTLNDETSTEDDINAVEAGDYVTIERSITTGWNAICLPFAVSADDLTTIFGENAEVGELTGAELDGTTQKLIFSKADAITAGKPCLLYSDNEVSEFTLKGVEAPSDATEVTAGNCVMKGALVKTTSAINSGEIYMNSGTLYIAQKAWDIKGFRSWIVPSENSGARNVEIVMDGTTTAISAATLGTEPDGDVFDLSGRKVTTPTKKGVYVKNGKKMVIK